MIYKLSSKLVKINAYRLLHLPLEVSKALPSRGMVMIQGTINEMPFQAALEPDGNGSHWFEIPEDFFMDHVLKEDETLRVQFEVMSEWPSPKLPVDLNDALVIENLTEAWASLTPKAQWEWLRWIRATKNSETRQKRINVACSKLSQGDRRPCCFDASKCSVPEVSKSGVLISVAYTPKQK